MKNWRVPDPRLPVWSEGTMGRAAPSRKGGTGLDCLQGSTGIADGAGATVLLVEK